MTLTSSPTHGPIPPFLRLKDSTQDASSNETKPYYETLLHHAALDCDAFTLWWPPTLSTGALVPDVVVLFIPGNPGMLGLYTTFLSALHSKAKEASQSIAILAQAHIGLAPELPPPPISGPVTLQMSVDSAIDALDNLASQYGSKTKYILVGHSLGTWISTLVLKARPNLVSSVLMLFPTISNIAKTPNGRRFGWALREPIAWLAANGSYLLRPLPRFFVTSLHSHWPPEQIDVLFSFLRSPYAIRNTLKLAHEEMLLIKELDIAMLREHENKLHFYFGEKDNWVGDEKNLILSSLAEPAGVKVVHGMSGIPHDFCINHGEQLAQQCLQWLKE